MPDKIYGGLHENEFRKRAKKAVVEYWNAHRTLPHKFKEIKTSDVYIVWQVKAIQNSKALLGVKVKDDGLYFEVTWNGDSSELYLDVYRKQKHITVEY